MVYLVLLHLALSLYYVTTLGETSSNLGFGLILSDQALEKQIKQIFDDEGLLEELFPMLQRSCVKSALQIFLPQCLLEGIETVTDSIKMDTAVRLSLCQFEASGLAQIPEECSHTESTEDMMACMLELETSNKWWTTYNGYYQNLPMMCITHGSMFQREQIIKTFMNITKFVNQLNENWGTVFKTNMDEVDKIISYNLNNLTVKFNHTLNQVDNFNASMNSIVQKMQTSLLKNKDEVQLYISRKDEEIKKSVITLQKFINQLKNDVVDENFLLDLENRRRGELSLWNEMETALQAERDFRLKEQENINIYLDNLKTSIINLNGNMESLNQFQIKNLENHVRAELTNISNQIINEWLSLTKILNKDIQYWNELIKDNFKMISSKLEITIEKIDFVENKICKIVKVFLKIYTVFEYCFKVVFTIFNNCRGFAIFVVFLPLIKVLRLKISILKINRFIVILLGILLGNQLGHKLSGISSIYRFTMINNPN